MKLVLQIAVLFSVLTSFAQQKQVKHYHDAQSKQNVFDKSKGFKAGEDWKSVYPYSLGSDYQTYTYSEKNQKNEIQHAISKEQLNQSRKLQYGEQYGEGVVNKPNPDMVVPEPIQFPEIDIPEIDTPDIDLPDIDFNFGTWEFWKHVLLIIVVIALIFGLYLFLKHMLPKNARVQLAIDDDWNPTVVTKSELEKRLEEAVLGNNFRECVRIHFMYILKELIKGKFIQWEADKTNYDYLNELRKTKGIDDFQECVRIYNIVWYGDYEIAESDYQKLKPTFIHYYQSIKTDEA